MFGKRLRLVAVKAFGSMKKLSEVSGINYTQISDYLSERRSPGFEALSAFANVGINVDWLLTGEGEMMRDTDFHDGSAMSIELEQDIETYQNMTVELNNKLDQFFRTKYSGRAAAGRLDDKEDSE